MDETKSYSRDSNVELLRIAAMLMIVTHHVLVHGVPGVYDAIYLQGQGMELCGLLNSFLIYGVDVFVMISGYYLIQTNLQRVTCFYFKCAFYAFIAYVAYMLLAHIPINRNLLKSTLFICSYHNTWWFIRDYFLLMLIAPLINKALLSASNRQVYSITALLAIVSVYFGWWRYMYFNPDGFNIFNFIWLYCLGFSIRLLFSSIKSFKYLRLSAISTWIACSLMIFVCYKLRISHMPYAYNNPFVVLGAVAIFIFFLSFNFQHRLVNVVASSTMGIYLLHAHFGLFELLNEWIHSNIVTLWQVPLFAMIIFTTCCVISLIINRLITPPYAIICRRITWKGVLLYVVLINAVVMIIDCIMA